MSQLERRVSTLEAAATPPRPPRAFLAATWEAFTPEEQARIRAECSVLYLATVRAVRSPLSTD